MHGDSLAKLIACLVRIASFPDLFNGRVASVPSGAIPTLTRGASIVILITNWCCTITNHSVRTAQSSTGCDIGRVVWTPETGARLQDGDEV